MLHLPKFNSQYLPATDRQHFCIVILVPSLVIRKKNPFDEFSLTTQRLPVGTHRKLQINLSKQGNKLEVLKSGHNAKS